MSPMSPMTSGDMMSSSAKRDDHLSLDIRVIMGVRDGGKGVDPASPFRGPQMQAYFWYQAHQLGAYARVEASLPGAGIADLLISRDLRATEPLIVVEFKERLVTPGARSSGLGQVRRYQAWLKRNHGAVLAFLVADTVPAALMGEYRTRNSRPVTVTDAAGLEAALANKLPRLIAGEIEPKRASA